VSDTQLEEFIRETMRQIKAGAGEKHVREPVEFEVALTEKKEGGGGVKVYVVSAGGSASSEVVQKIKFKVDPREPMKPISRMAGGNLQSDPFS